MDKKLSPKDIIKRLGQDAKMRRTISTRHPDEGFAHERENPGEIAELEQATGHAFVGEGRDSTVWEKDGTVTKVNDPEKFSLARIKEISYTHKILALIFPDHFVAPISAEWSKDAAFTEFPYIEGEDFQISQPRNLHRENLYKFFRETGLLHPVHIDYTGKGNLKVVESGAHIYVDYVYDLILSREDKVKLLGYLIDKKYGQTKIELIDMLCDAILALKGQ